MQTICNIVRRRLGVPVTIEPVSAAVNPMGGAFAHRGDQPSQHGLPGQQDLPGQKLPVGRAEQHRRGHLIGPGLPVQPDGEGEPVRPSEVAVPVAVPDLGGVPPPHRHVPVAGQHFQVIDAELACHSGHDRPRYRGRVRLERADRPDGDQLGRSGAGSPPGPPRSDGTSAPASPGPAQPETGRTMRRWLDPPLPAYLPPGQYLLQAPASARPDTASSTEIVPSLRDRSG